MLVLAVVLVAAAIPAWARWTASQQVPDQTFTLGSFDLVVNDSDPFTTFSLPNATAMYPTTSTAAVLTVRNAGNVPLDYYADASATNALGAALQFTVTTGAVTGTAPNQTCSGTVVAGPLNLTASAGPFVASNAARRPLAVGASEPLCIQAALPADAPGTLQGGTTALTITFHAKQVGAP